MLTGTNHHPCNHSSPLITAHPSPGSSRGAQGPSMATLIIEACADGMNEGVDEVQDEGMLLQQAAWHHHRIHVLPLNC